MEKSVTTWWKNGQELMARSSSPLKEAFSSLTERDSSGGSVAPVSGDGIKVFGS